MTKLILYKWLGTQLQVGILWLRLLSVRNYLKFDKSSVHFRKERLTLNPERKTHYININIYIVPGGKSGKYPGRNLPSAQCKMRVIVLSKKSVQHLPSSCTYLIRVLESYNIMYYALRYWKRAYLHAYSIHVCLINEIENSQVQCS